MDLEIMASVQEHIIGNCLCVLGDAMAMPIGSMIAKFSDEFEAHIEAARVAPRAARAARRAGRAARAARAALDAAPEPQMITFTIDGREVQAPENTMLVDAAKHGDVEIPVFCYEPKLGQPGRRLPHVPGGDRGHPQAADGLLDAGQGRHGRLHPDRAREDRAAVGGGVPADQPPAGLPRVRQGRRVPAAGHHLRLGRRHLALHRAQAPLRQAAGALAADRDRPRALHPLLPLRALLPGGRRGLPAGAARARRPLLRLDVRRPPLRGALQRQHRRAVPRRRAHLAPLPLPRAPVGHRGRGLGVHAVPRPVQRHASPSATSVRCACWRATTSRSTTAGCATRAASPTSPSTWTSASPSRWCATAAQLRPVSWERALEAAAAGLAPRGRERGRDRGRAGDQRGGLPARAPDARGPRLAAPGLAPRRQRCRWSCTARSATRRLQATVSDLEFAHAVLVLDAEPVNDAPILDLRLRKGVRRHGLQLAVASPHASSLDGSAALSVRYALGAGAAFAAALRAALAGDGRRRAARAVRRAPSRTRCARWRRF